MSRLSWIRSSSFLSMAATSSFNGNAVTIASAAVGLTPAVSRAFAALAVQEQGLRRMHLGAEGTTTLAQLTRRRCVEAVFIRDSR